MSSYEPIGWDEALDIVAGAFRKATEEHGAQSVWPYYFAGTMGLIQRDSIERFRNSLGYSRQHLTICTTLVDSGWVAGVGTKMGVDPREMAESDLIVMWVAIRQHPSERDAPHLKSQAHAQRQTRCDRPVPDRNGRKSGHASHGAT